MTVASRIMLPVYVLFFAGLGINYLATPPARLKASPALAYAASIMPLPAWGALFLAAAVLMAAALVTGARTLYRFALLLCALAMGVWTVLNIAAVFATKATPGGWLWPFLVVAACAASYRSLTAGEVD